MPHHPEQNVLRKVFILCVCFDILHTERVSCKEEDTSTVTTSRQIQFGLKLTY